MIAQSVGAGINALISHLLGAGRRDEPGKAAAAGVGTTMLSATQPVIVDPAGAQKIAHGDPVEPFAPLRQRGLQAPERLLKKCLNDEGFQG